LVLSVIGWGLSDIGHKGKDEILKMKKKNKPSNYFEP